MEQEEQKEFSFHKNYWEWEVDNRGYLVVKKK